MVETLIRRKEALALQGNLRKFLLGTEEKSGCDAVGLQLPVEAVRTFWSGPRPSGKEETVSNNDSCRSRFISEVVFCFVIETDWIILHLYDTDTKRGCPECMPSSMVHPGRKSAGFHLLFFNFHFLAAFCCFVFRIDFIVFDTTFGGLNKSPKVQNSNRTKKGLLRIKIKQTLSIHFLYPLPPALRVTGVCWSVTQLSWGEGSVTPGTSHQSID